MFRLKIINIHFSLPKKFFCVVGLKTLIHAQSSITVLTIVYSHSSFVMLAAEHTPS
jgi:hypothetical protein